MDVMERVTFLSGGIPYQAPQPVNKNENDPSLSYTRETAFEEGPRDDISWDYKVEEVGGEKVGVKSPYKWVIQSTSIVDNGKGTSRVTFTFKSWSRVLNIKKNIITEEQ